MNKIPILMGPTASGKTGLAIALAQALDGEVINADSMQIYRDLRTITARPTEQEEAQVPHHLFGILEAGDACNAQRWSALAEAKIAEICARGRCPILVGGTGFYVRALTQGLDEIPTISEAVRSEVRALTTVEAEKALNVEDPKMASQFEPADGQRIRRALEVFRQTGRSLSEFQQGEQKSDDQRFAIFKLLPDRDLLYARCDQRLELMWDEAIEEVRLYLDLNPDPSWPLSKAIGVPQVREFLESRLSNDQALELAQQKTRNYAKRQLTWLRNQHSCAKNLLIHAYCAQQMQSLCENIIANLAYRD